MTKTKYTTYRIIIGLALVFSGNNAFAKYFDYGVALGERVDQLKWNISGTLDGRNPNILSELEWKDIKALQLQLYAEGVDRKNNYYEGYYNYGYIISGNHQDSDYLSDNRQDEFSRSIGDSDKGSLTDASIAYGYRFWKRVSDSKAVISIIPMVGYSQHEQNLKMTNGYQLIDTIMSDLGSFPGLNSKYETEWTGFWIGTNIYYEMYRAFKVSLSYQWHNADYKAKADWNLRQDFKHPVSFRHSADGEGDVFILKFKYTPSKKWSFQLEAKQQKWKAKNGKDITYFSDGGVGRTRLNEVIWDSKSLMLKAHKYF